jgi:hypothetical protein
MPLNFDPNDSQVAQRLISGLPAVLPSLSKPDKPARIDPSFGIGTAGLPPVTTPTPSPEERRVAGVQAKLEKLQQTPSWTAGVQQKANQYHTEHPGALGRIAQVGAGILRGVDIGGEILAPNIARNIPGTGLNRSQNIAQTQAELGQAEKQAVETRKTPETQAFESETGAGKTPMQAYGDVEAAKRAPAKLDKPENLEQNYADAVATAQAAGRDPATDPAAQQWADAITSLKPDKKPVLDKKIDAYVGKDNKRMEVMQKPDGSTYVQPETETRPPGTGASGPFMVDANGRVFKPKEGQTLPEGSQTVSGVAGAETKKIGGVNTAGEAATYAKTYLTQTPTGPGDEALMEKFFELAKPSSGFRMTQNQMDMLLKARSWMDSAEAQTRHATEGTYFSTEQRKQIANTMGGLQTAKGGAKGAGLEFHSFTFNGQRYENVPSELYKKYKGKTGFSE